MCGSGQSKQDKNAGGNIIGGQERGPKVFQGTVENARWPMDLSKRFEKVDDLIADAHAWAFFKSKKEPVMYHCAYPLLDVKEVKARVLYCGINKIDSDSINEKWGERPFPCVPGHEIIAEVIEVGSACKLRKKGDIIGIGFARDSCGQCRCCKLGLNHLCENYTVNQMSVFGHEFGGLSTKIHIREDYTIKIPPKMNHPSTAPLLGAGISAYRPLRDHVNKGDKVGVVGIGGLGHLAVQFAAALGAEVVAFTRSKSKVEQIKSLGAHKVVVIDDGLNNWTEHESTIDILINATPYSSPEDFDNYIRVLKHNGKMILVTIPSLDSQLNCWYFPVIVKQIQVIGSVMGSIDDHQEMINFAEKNGIKSIIEEFKFEDFPKAYAKMQNGLPQFRCVINIKDYSKKYGL